MEKLAVIGCGTMGHTIALNAAWMGIDVILYGIGEVEIQQAEKEMNKKFETLQKNDLLGQQDLLTIKNSITTTTSLALATKESTFIIEAVPEILSIKRTVYNEIEELCSPDTIIASNTSGLLPSELSAEMKNPERMVVTHFWNPAHLVPLVEVVGNPKTSEQTIERALTLLKSMKKKPIFLTKEIAGFIGNRLQYALFREAQFLLEQGITSKEEIDTAVQYSIGRRYPVTGPFLSADMGGLDVFSTISDYLFKQLSNATESYPIIRNLVDNNKYGYKTGEGYYNWDDERLKNIDNLREQELIYYLKKDFKESLTRGG